MSCVSDVVRDEIQFEYDNLLNTISRMITHYCKEIDMKAYHGHWLIKFQHVSPVISHENYTYHSTVAIEACFETDNPHYYYIVDGRLYMHDRCDQDLYMVGHLDHENIHETLKNLLGMFSTDAYDEEDQYLSVPLTNIDEKMEETHDYSRIIKKMEEIEEYSSINRVVYTLYYGWHQFDLFVVPNHFHQKYERKEEEPQKTAN